MACFFLYEIKRYALVVLILPSFAKINLGLRVLGKRADGFHDLCTIFQTISLQDTLTFQEADSIRLTCDADHVPTDERNLIIKAAKRLNEICGTEHGVAVALEKRIPSPGGLGGGSSNAAVTLLALNKLWQLGISVEELHSIAADLGSDMPFFLYGGTSIGTGRGTVLDPVEDIRLPLMVVVTPNINVSTADAFRSLSRESLTTEAAESILLNCRFAAKNGVFAEINLENDFEKPVFEAYPEIGKVKQRLLELGASRAALSGSGATVYGSFENEETRQTALKALGNEPNWRSFAVAAISRSDYHEALKQVL